MGPVTHPAYGLPLASFQPELRTVDSRRIRSRNRQREQRTRAVPEIDHAPYGISQ